LLASLQTTMLQQSWAHKTSRDQDKKERTVENERIHNNKVQKNTWEELTERVSRREESDEKNPYRFPSPHNKLVRMEKERESNKEGGGGSKIHDKKPHIQIDWEQVCKEKGQLKRWGKSGRYEKGKTGE